MINFYNYIHTNLCLAETNELIVWPQSSTAEVSTFTNENLFKLVSDCRAQLLAQSVKPGDKVLLAMQVSITPITILLAVQSLGGIPVLPPAKAGLTALLSVIRKEKIKVIVTGEKPGVFISIALQVAGVKCLQFRDAVEEKNTAWEPVLVPPDQAALITYSSGSTGKPKAIYRSHAVLSAQHLVLKEVFPPWPLQRDFPLFPNIILHNLAAGVLTIIPAIPGFDTRKMNSEAIAEQLISQRIDTMTGNVYYFKKLLTHFKEQQTFPLVKAVGIGGSPVPEQLVHRLKRHFINADCYIIYGSSEAEPISIRKINAKEEEPLNGYAVGQPCAAVKLRINAMFEIQTPAGLVAAGEIEVSGAHVATANNEEWLQTGDFGYVTADGSLYLTARKGNERPHGAIQHYQIEHLLRQQKDIANAGVVSLSDGFYVHIEGAATKEKIWQIVHMYLPKGIIKDVYFRTGIPVDARHHSKILYGKLT